MHSKRRMVLQLKHHFLEMGKEIQLNNKQKNRKTFSVSFSRNTVLTFDRRVNIKNETECLHKIGLSKQLQGGIKSQQELEQIRSLVPETFQDFVTRTKITELKTLFNKFFVFCLEMAMSGSLKTLFESRTSTAKSTSSTNLPPVCFKIEGKHLFN